jgi:hypothetical protein
MYRNRAMETEMHITRSEIARFIAYEFRASPDVVAAASHKIAGLRELTAWDRLSRKPLWQGACEFLPPLLVAALWAKYQSKYSRTQE